jgi:hypothetical protein
LLNENIIIIFEKNMKTHRVSLQMGKYKCENLVSLLTILMGYFHSRTLLKICLPDKIWTEWFNINNQMQFYSES